MSLQHSLEQHSRKLLHTGLYKDETKSNVDVYVCDIPRSAEPVLRLRLARPVRDGERRVSESAQGDGK